MKRLLCTVLCLLVLLIPVFAEPTAQAHITSYDTVCTVESSGACEVTVRASVAFPEGATSFLIPLPPAAEEITVPGLSYEQTLTEDRILLFLEKTSGFSPDDTVTVMYRLPQIVESWDKKQTMTLPLLFGEWNAEIDFFHLQLNLPGQADDDVLIYDADGDRIKDLFTVTAENNVLTMETGGKPFTPRNTTLEMEFGDGYFTLPDLGDTQDDPNATQISSLDAACAVLSDSSCFVSMKAEYNFRDHPSFVQIPVPADAYEITVGGMQFSEKRDSGCTLLVIENPAGFNGMQSFEITYRMLTTATEAEDAQLLTLPLIFSQWLYRIRNFSLSMTLPSDFEGLPEFISSYYNDQIDNYLDIQIDKQTVLAHSLQPLMEQESLTVQLELPADYFDLRFLQGRFSTFEIVLFLLAAALCIVYWFFFLRNGLRQIVPEPQAPLGCNAGQIPYLLQQKAPSFGLMTVTWASLGYLFIERTKSRRLYLTRRINMKNERSRCETQLFSALFARKRDCLVLGRTYVSSANRSYDLTKEDWQSRLRPRRRAGKAWLLRALGVLAAAGACLLVFDRLMTPQSFRWLLIVPLSLLGAVSALLIQQLAGLHFERHPWKRRIAAYAVLLALGILGIVSGCFFVVLINCLLQFLISLVLLPGGKRSGGGNRLFYQLLGLRKYLRSLDVADIELLLENDPQYYYRALPYAEALGIGAAFTKKFAGFRLEPCHWLNWKGLAVDRAEDFYHRFCVMVDEMDSVGKKTLFR